MKVVFSITRTVLSNFIQASHKNAYQPQTAHSDYLTIGSNQKQNIICALRFFLFSKQFGAK